MTITPKVQNILDQEFTSYNDVWNKHKNLWDRYQKDPNILYVDNRKLELVITTKQTYKYLDTTNVKS